MRAQRVFGYPLTDGVASVPFVSIMGATLDDRDALVVVGGLPERDAIAGRPYVLWEDEPYRGPRGAMLARPGW